MPSSNDQWRAPPPLPSRPSTPTSTIPPGASAAARSSPSTSSVSSASLGMPDRPGSILNPQGAAQRTTTFGELVNNNRSDEFLTQPSPKLHRLLVGHVGCDFADSVERDYQLSFERIANHMYEFDLDMDESPTIRGELDLGKVRVSGGTSYHAVDLVDVITTWLSDLSDSDSSSRSASQRQADRRRRGIRQPDYAAVAKVLPHTPQLAYRPPFLTISGAMEIKSDMSKVKTGLLQAVIYTLIVKAMTNGQAGGYVHRSRFVRFVPLGPRRVAMDRLVGKLGGEDASASPTDDVAAPGGETVETVEAGGTAMQVETASEGGKRKLNVDEDDHTVLAPDQFVDVLDNYTDAQVAASLPFSLRLGDAKQVDMDAVRALGTLLNAVWDPLLALPTSGPFVPFPDAHGSLWDDLRKPHTVVSLEDNDILHKALRIVRRKASAEEKKRTKKLKVGAVSGPSRTRHADDSPSDSSTGPGADPNGSGSNGGRTRREGRGHGYGGRGEQTESLSSSAQKDSASGVSRSPSAAGDEGEPGHGAQYGHTGREDHAGGGSEVAGSSDDNGGGWDADREDMGGRGLEIGMDEESIWGYDDDDKDDRHNDPLDGESPAQNEEEDMYGTTPLDDWDIESDGELDPRAVKDMFRRSGIEIVMVSRPMMDQLLEDVAAAATVNQSDARPTPRDACATAIGAAFDDRKSSNGDNSPAAGDEPPLTCAV